MLPGLGSLPAHLDQGALLDKLSGGSQENLKARERRKKEERNKQRKKTKKKEREPSEKEERKERGKKRDPKYLAIHKVVLNLLDLE